MQDFMQTTDLADLKEIYLQPILLILINTFWPEYMPAFYPFRSQEGFSSDPLVKLLERLKQNGSVYLEQNENRAIIQPTNAEERARFPRIGNMEPKIFFEFLVGSSRHYKNDLQPLVGQKDPIYILLLIYAVIAISYAQVLHKKGIQTPALLLTDTKSEVLEFVMNWTHMVPELNGILVDFIKPFFNNYWTCYHFLIDSYFPKAKFEI